MASSGVNVLRYAALAAGIAYGITHQSSITARSHQHHLEAENKHQESVIQKAKAEWVKKTAPAGSSASAAVVIDPTNPMFDMEALLSKLADGSLQV